mmetsp:Transcript_72537/g.226171  ORF Transcript_72537/g.226171 Transcript_72537/m.226171 type:complete len:298 (-) Transcript_72537:942-1835(-)
MRWWQQAGVRHRQGHLRFIRFSTRSAHEVVLASCVHPLTVRIQAHVGGGGRHGVGVRLVAPDLVVQALVQGLGQELLEVAYRRHLGLLGRLLAGRGRVRWQRWGQHEVRGDAHKLQPLGVLARCSHANGGPPAAQALLLLLLLLRARSGGGRAVLRLHPRPAALAVDDVGSPHRLAEPLGPPPCPSAREAPGAGPHEAVDHLQPHRKSVIGVFVPLGAGGGFEAGRHARVPVAEHRLNAGNVALDQVIPHAGMPLPAECFRLLNLRRNQKIFAACYVASQLLLPVVLHDLLEEHLEA